MKESEKQAREFSDEHQTSGDAVVGNHEKITDSVFITEDAPKGTARGTWVTKGDTIFVKNDYDFAGSTGTSSETDFENAYDGNMQNCAMISFLHSGNASNPSNKTYQVYLTLKNLNSPWADNEQGLNSTREWFLDHIGGYADGESSAATQNLVQKPTRDNPYKSSDPDSSTSIDYNYEEVICEPGKGAGFVTRGFEVDNQEVNSDAFDIEFKDWVKLLWAFSDAVLTRKYTDFVIEVTTMLFKAALGNEDDPMTPVVTAFSHEACQFIYENCPNKTFSFKRKALGMETYLAEITRLEGGFEETNEWSIGDYVQYLNSYDTRHYELEYEVRIGCREDMAGFDGKTFTIQEKQSGLVWEIGNDGTYDVLIGTNTVTGALNQQFKFEKQASGRFIIRSKVDNAPLRGQDRPYAHTFIPSSDEELATEFDLVEIVQNSTYVIRCYYGDGLITAKNTPSNWVTDDRDNSYPDCELILTLVEE